MGNNYVGPMIAFFVVGVIVLVVLFLLFREFFCWYWKFNQSVGLLTEIRDLLATGGRSQGEVASVASKQASTARFCAGCGAGVVEGDSDFCQSCGAKL